MDPEDAQKIIEGVAFIDEISGSDALTYSETEKAARLNARRSIVSACNISAGDVITREMLTFKRPGTGIAPSEIEKIIGKTAQVAIPGDTILEENSFFAE